MRVVQRGYGVSFTLETPTQVFALGNVSRKNLDGDKSIKSCVTGFIDFSHAPAPISARMSYRPSFSPAAINTAFVTAYRKRCGRVFRLSVHAVCHQYCI